MKYFLAVVCVWLFVGQFTAGASSDEFPFREYPISEQFSGTPGRPILRTRFQRLYRTTIREQSAKGPNFAGSFTVVHWGIGSGFRLFVIVDARTGEVYQPPFHEISTDEWDRTVEGGVHYRLDSSLLVVAGCPEDLPCGVRYYNWNSHRLTLRKFNRSTLQPAGD